MDLDLADLIFENRFLIWNN